MVFKALDSSARNKVREGVSRCTNKKNKEKTKEREKNK